MKKYKLKDLVKNFSVLAKNVGGSEGLEFLGVSNEDGITKSKYAAEDKAEDYKIIEKGCFAYNPYRINVGSIAYVNDDIKGLISPAYVIFKTKPNTVDDRLLLKFLKSAEGLRQIKINARGSVRQALRFEDLCNIEINLPDYSEQVKFLDKIEIIDDASKNVSSEITHQLDLIKDLRQAFLREAMQGILVSSETQGDSTGTDLLAEIQTEKAQLVKEKKNKKPKPLAPITEDELPFDIPENWTWCRGEMIAQYIDPQPSHRTPPVSKDSVPYVAMSDIRKDGTIDFLSARKVSNEVLLEHQNRYTLQDGDFIFGKIGTIGKPVYLPRPFNYTLSANVILIQAERKIMNSNYLFYFLSSSVAEKFLLEQKSTMSYPVFGMAKARNMLVPLPPLEIQERIVAKLDELMTVCDALETQVKQSGHTNEQLLQQVLREALGA